VQLRDAVHEPAEVLGRLVGMAVPGRIVVGIPQAEIGAEVNDRLGQALQLPDPPHGAAVGQAEEQDVAGLEVVEAGELEPGLLAKVGMERVDEVARAGFRGRLDDLDIRMAEQDPEGLASGVAGGPDDAGGDHG